ncbi:DUF4278 domain-containing protein [Phormidium sp. CCY1219]|uniref:DUF4278 domain-containing protein n=1 Tax=Phormidium sp. CCY1219 TaxID=2886104 RepID=UPI002D1F37D5|nr:DUF4278 domain-containing protein [Phormidium sp. CCY1219]MEB3828841.1 DUF4278 domain-containing protein [Phormidium sp. CCY1219]
MKLSYRGTTYEYTPPTVEVTEVELGGKYRGLDWKFCNTQKQPVHQTTVELKYRGAPVANGTAEAATVSAPEKARNLMMNRQVKTQKRQRSMLSRLVGELQTVPVVAH